jgi:uncharacterized membrane protein (DUF373 family)
MKQPEQVSSSVNQERPLHTDVHHIVHRYLELAQDFIVAFLAVVLLIVMIQGLISLGTLAFVLNRKPAEVLSQIVLLFVLVELFRTLVFYLREHRVSVPMMLEVAIVSELREVLLSQPAGPGTQLMGTAILLLVMGTLFLGYRVTQHRIRPNSPRGWPSSDEDP